MVRLEDNTMTNEKKVYFDETHKENVPKNISNIIHSFHNAKNKRKVKTKSFDYLFTKKRKISAKSKKRRGKYIFRIFVLFLNWCAEEKYDAMFNFFKSISDTDRNEVFNAYGDRMFGHALQDIDPEPLELIEKYFTTQSMYQALSKDNFKLLNFVLRRRAAGEELNENYNTWYEKLKVLDNIERTVKVTFLDKESMLQLCTSKMRDDIQQIKGSKHAIRFE